MNRDELKAYLQAQMDAIQRYQHEQASSGRPDLDFKRAIEEWIERFAENFRRDWDRERAQA